MKATEKFFAALKRAGSQKECLDEMQTRQELYDLLDYDPASEEWKGFRD
jgi:2-methylisocitrate lyase-like PEP mutase family enzyme